MTISGLGMVARAGWLLSLLALAIAPALSAEPLAGRASVIDGDTLVIHGTHVRLFAIDAPESRQTCQHADGTTWRCGQAASLALADKIGARTVSCEPRDVDRYHRVVAVCSAGGVDLSGWMVAQGWALAYRRYSLDYVEAEEAAHSAKRGIWAGSFVEPWEWRRAKRWTTTRAPVASYPILARA